MQCLQILDCGWELRGFESAAPYHGGGRQETLDTGARSEIGGFRIFLFGGKEHPYAAVLFFYFGGIQ